MDALFLKKEKKVLHFIIVLNGSQKLCSKT